MRVLAGMVVLSLTFAVPMVRAEARPPALAIRNVTVVEVRDGTLRAGSTVVVEGERIAAVGSVGEVPIPESAEVLDGAGTRPDAGSTRTLSRLRARP